MKTQDENSTFARLATVRAHYAGTLTGDAPKRFAYVLGARRPEEVEAYLPSGYGLMESFPGTIQGRERLVVVIGGQDAAGWTLDGYVVPRLASGLLTAVELP